MKPTNNVKWKQIRRLLFLVLVLMLFEVSSCRSQEKITELEIYKTFTGSAAYRGDFLVFRMYRTGDVEYDCTRDTNLPLSRANIFTRQAVLPKQDAELLRKMLRNLEASSFEVHYESNEKWSDVGEFSVIVFLDSEKEAKRITFTGDVLLTSSWQTADKPASLDLEKLVEMIKYFRRKGCE
jgi:hypothetical protein